MSPLFERVLATIERWLDRVVVPDERYVCGGCDDRFPNRALGVAHIQRCHPEFRGVVVFEDDDTRIGLAA